MGPIILGATSLCIALAYEPLAYLCRFLPGRRRMRRVADVALRAMDDFVRCAKAYIGLRLRYEPPAVAVPDRCVVVSNHQSLLDIPVLMHYFRPYGRILFVAKKELGWGIPLISSVLKVGGHALIDRRARPAEAMRGLGRFARRCDAAGFLPSIFPEGTRSRDGELGAFHAAGLRRILENYQAPILVVAIDGGAKARRLGAVLAGESDLEYRVKALALLEAGADKKAASLALETARTMIAQQLGAWRGEDPRE